MNENTVKELGGVERWSDRLLTLREYAMINYDLSKYSVRGAEFDARRMIAATGDTEQFQTSLRGVNLVRRVDGLLAYPRLSRRGMHELEYLTGGSYDHVMAMFLQTALPANSDMWKEYVATRSVKRMAVDDEIGRYEVVRTLEPKTVPPSEMRLMAGNTVKERKYTLASVFSDPYLADKYDVPIKLVRDMQLLAAKRPGDAASTLQQAMQRAAPEGVRVRVLAGQYANTKTNATSVLYAFSARLPQASASIAASVIGNKLLMYSQDKDHPWFVEGPLSSAGAVNAAYNIGCSIGIHETSFLFAMETVLLGIAFNDGEHWVSSTVEGHVGTSDTVYPDQHNSVTWGSLDDSQRAMVANMSRAVRPVYKGDCVVASAIQILDGFVTLNEHVISSGDCSLTAAGAVVSGTIPFTRDLWVQAAQGQAFDWVLRDPVVGERVALLLHNGSDVVLSETVFVERVDGVNLLTGRSSGIVGGMSGAAVIGLRDMALLGFHSAAGLRSDIHVRYDESMLADLMTQVATLEQASGERASEVDKVVHQLKDKGLFSVFKQAAESVVALHDVRGNHVGSAVAFSGNYYTGCPAGHYKLDGVTVEFVQDSGLLSVYQPGVRVQAQPPLVRLPENFEPVVVLGCDSDGLFASRETRVALVPKGKRTFSLGATNGNIYSLMGGLVVSVRDSAVLGLYIRETSTILQGKLSLCATFSPTGRDVDEDPKAVLRRVFPMLNLSAWTDDVLHEALRHPSAKVVGVELFNDYMGLSRIGGAVMLHKLYVSLWTAGKPPAVWSDFQRQLQSKLVCASLAVEAGVHQLLIKQQGVSFVDGADAHADLLKSLIACVSMFESESVLDQFLSLLGVVPGPDEFKTRDTGFGKLMRRQSELAVPSATGVPISPVD